MIFFWISSREMGLGHSKHQSRVIKVTPLQSQEAETPSAGPVFYALNRNLEEKNSYPFSRLQDQNPALERQLPPLRETWYGRHPAGTPKTKRDICMYGTRENCGYSYLTVAGTAESLDYWDAGQCFPVRAECLSADFLPVHSNARVDSGKGTFHSFT